MSLKGYQWLDDEEKVIMSYYFKDETLYIWKDTTIDELEKFKKYLKEHYCETIHIDYNNHIVN